jgi:DNA helicase-2/ATP-dependent DNA helicase PcrA
VVCRAVGRAYITTMSSKALEFDLALMLGLEEGRLPFWRSTGPQLAEDRRKFYVSLTRAREAAHLFHSGWYETRFGPRRNGGTKAGLRQRPSIPLRSTRLPP